MTGNPLTMSEAANGRGLRLRDIPGLIKAHLSLYIALTAAAGHALAQNRLSAMTAWSFCGWVGTPALLRGRGAQQYPGPGPGPAQYADDAPVSWRGET